MDGKENIYQRYKTYLRLEKALSANTIEAYLADLDKLVRFVESEGKDIRKITYDDLQQFVAQLHDVGIHARSQARIISGIKSFYKYLLLDGYIESDPKFFRCRKSTGCWILLIFLRLKVNGTGLCWKCFTVADCVFLNW